MILIDKHIRAAVATGAIVVDPWDEESLGTNSYDVHLGPVLRTYVPLFDANFKEIPLTVLEKRATEDRTIGPDGFLLQPGELYLASTIEYTESHEHVPVLNGKSSLGRLGLSIHVTAGTGDVGFCNHWTLELFVIKPLVVVAGMPIGQLMWLEPSGVPDIPYHMKRSAKYRSRSDAPQASEMADNFRKAR